MTSLQKALADLPANASEAIVNQQFVVPALFDALGFKQNEVYPQYDTGNPTGNRIVDHAARKNTQNDIFISTGINPYLLVELKGKDINLSEETAGYAKAVQQLKSYLLAPKCTTAHWGMITNSTWIQLFRKHGKVIHPATHCLKIDSSNIATTVQEIREKLEAPIRALTIAVYNNKGGVGKTTTTVNLAAVLTLLGKKVLIIDFDPNQQDLTSSLGLKLSSDNFYRSLVDKDSDIATAIKPYCIRNKSTSVSVTFDVIPADEKLANETEADLKQSLKLHRLSQSLQILKQNYDYILIDSPPNWRFFSQSAIYAADVVLIPTKHNNLFSLENAATAIKSYIPEIRRLRKDGSPIALPIFFNGEKQTEAQIEVAKQEINNIIKQGKSENVDLQRFFYPRYTNANKNFHIFELPSYANIANAAFARIPAVYRDKTARDYYLSLAREYFIQ